MSEIKRFLLLITIAVFMTSCASGGNNKSHSGGYAERSMPAEGEPQISADDSSPMYSGESSKSGNSVIRPKDRKLILHYDLSFDTKNYDEAVEKAVSLIAEFKGYQTQMEESSGSIRYTSIEAMIPTDNVEKFIERLGNEKSLNTVRKNLSSEDITDRYTDTELRLKILKEKLERLQNMTKEKSSLEELLALEQEISDTIFNIENIQGNLNKMDTQVNYTKVSMYINEIKATPNYEPTKVSFSERVLEAFKESGENFVEAIQGIIIFVIMVAPQLLIVIVIILLIYFITKPLRAKFSRKKKDTAKNDTVKNNDVKKS